MRLGLGAVGVGFEPRNRNTQPLYLYPKPRTCPRRIVVLVLLVMQGVKSATERFAGADETFTIEVGLGPGLRD